MKILVYSDSHGKISNIVEAYEIEKPDFVISAGDHAEDFEEFKHSYREREILHKVVRGNCDYYSREYGEEELFELGSKRFFLTHGHLFGVKNGLDLLVAKSQEYSPDIIIFGHTHRAVEINFEHRIYFNPGALNAGQYGIIEIEGEKMSFAHKTLG